MTQVSDVLDVLKQLSDSPTDRSVREQSFSFYPCHWNDRWPTHHQRPERLAGREPRQRLSRADLLRRAQEVATEEDALDLYVAVCSWGAGPKARAIARCVKPLQDPEAPRKLLRSLKHVRESGPVPAYQRLARGGEDNIRHLGPAFFTKWLYFAGYDRTPPGEAQPLILDALVAAALGWGPTGWSSASYERYLRLAEDVVKAWQPEESVHVVEYALFRIGREGRRTARTGR